MTHTKQTSNWRRVALASASAAAIMATSAVHGIDVSGLVKTKNSADALEGAIIKIEQLNRRAVAGADGSYYFANIPAGTYTITVTYAGAEPVTREITVTDNGGNFDFEVVGANADIEEIFVTGQRGSLNSSLSKQRAADNVANFLSADSAGNFPDQNVSEAVRRVVGMSVENDQGEGRFVVIRGLDPNLNSSSVGGVRLPSPDGGDRKVALDVVPSELLETVEITKSLTPDMDGDAIGGNVDIKTLSGFDKDGMFIKAKVEGSYNDQQDKISPKFGLTFANKFSDKFAMSASVSYFDRKLGSDNLEVDGGWINEDDEDNEIDFLIPEELELRDYVVDRRRIGAALNLDFRPSENHDFYLRGLYSNFRDSEVRSRMELKFDEGEFVAVGGGTAFQEGIEVDRDVKDRIETQKIYTVVAGGESRFNNLTATYSLSFARAQEEEPDRLDSDFAGEDINAGVNVLDPLAPFSAFRSASDFAGITDLSAFELDTIEYSNNITEDDQFAARIDLAYDTYWDDMPLQIKWGAKARLRDKMRDDTLIAYDGDLGDLTLADFSTAIDYPLDMALNNVGPSISALRNHFNSNRSSFEADAADTTIGSYATDYEAEENIYATYLMGTLDVGDLRIVGGLRYERTEFDTTSNFVQVGEVVVTDPVTGQPILDDDGDPETEDVEVIDPINRSKDYGNWLPSVNMRWDISDTFVARAAFFRSVVRPNISDVVPTGEIEFEEEFDDGEIVRETEGAIGNPDLNPMTASNWDVSLEWYPSNNAVVSVGYFHKTLNNFIVKRTLENVTVEGVDFAEVVRPFNGDEATVSGLELNYQQALTFLPGFLDGLILGLNYTYVDSEARINTGNEVRTIPLPKTSENVANIILGYEKGPLSLRAAMSYRDEYLDELDAEGFGDRYALSHKQWDFSASYEVYEGIKVYGEVSNANDRPFQAVYRTDGRDYLMQHEQYDWTANMGVKVKF